jgi:hypothetical protein
MDQLPRGGGEEDSEDREEAERRTVRTERRR